MAKYMLYRTKSKDDNIEELESLRTEFEELYKKYNVNIVGFWENADDPQEVYYISKYKDEADYKSKTEQLRSDERYIELTKKLDELRLESQVIRLNPMWIPE
ncbi:MAG: NIPSNAP family protein [Candidatus Hodarchaeota archaeon]